MAPKGGGKGEGKGSKAHRVYVGTRPGAIHTFELDVETGGMSQIGSATDGPDGAGGFLAATDDGQFMYAVAKPGAAAFRIDEKTGGLCHINTVDCEASGNSHISLGTHGGARTAVLAAYGGGGVNVVKVQADGSLAKIEAGSAVMHSGGSGVHHEKDAQGVPHPHSGFVDRSGRRVLVSDLGQDKIYVYDIDAAAGRLQEKSVFSTAPGSGPRHLSFHPNGRCVFGINELDCTISAYKYSHSTGELGPILQTVSTLPEGYNNRDHANAKNAKGEPASGPNREDQTNATADIHVSPDGRFLYGSNRGHDSLVCFSVDSAGTLKLVGFTSTQGQHPRAFGIHPSGKWILVANQDSGDVVLFKVNKKTGELTQTGDKLPMKQPRCVQFVPYKVLQKPSFTTVAKIRPGSTGLNLFVKVVKELSGSDIVVGDATGVVTLRAFGGAQLAACQVGKVLRIQNARTLMDNKVLLLQVDKWGALAQAPSDHEDIEPLLSVDISESREKKGNL